MTPSAPGHEESPPPEYSEVVQCPEAQQTPGRKPSQFTILLGGSVKGQDYDNLVGDFN